MIVWVKGSHGIPGQYAEILSAEQDPRTGAYGYRVQLESGMIDLVGVDLVTYPELADPTEQGRTDNPSSASPWPFLPLDVVFFFEELAKKRGVSKVARSNQGFVRAYLQAAGNEHNLSAQWKQKRDGFIARHYAQVVKNNEALYDKKGLPTRRHLALIMWAFSPDLDGLNQIMHGRLSNRADNPSPEKTAIARNRLSAPVRTAMELGLFAERGDEVRMLREMGFDARGFEPYASKSRMPKKKSADYVYSNYVLNVIDDPEARLDALEDALSVVAPGGALLVSARSDKEIAAQKSKRWKKHSDGYLTSRDTFQKGISKEELARMLEEVGVDRGQVQFLPGRATAAVVHMSTGRHKNPSGHLLDSDTIPLDAGAYVYYQVKKPTKQQILSALFMDDVFWVMEKGKRGYFNAAGDFLGKSFDAVVEGFDFTEEEIYDAAGIVQNSKRLDIAPMLEYMEDYDRWAVGDQVDDVDVFDVPDMEDIAQAPFNTDVYTNIEQAMNLIDSSKASKKNIQDAITFVRQGMENASFDANDVIFVQNLLSRKKGKKVELPPTEAEHQMQDPFLVNDVVDIALEKFNLPDDPYVREEIIEEAKELAPDVEDIFEAVGYAASHYVQDTSPQALRSRREKYTETTWTPQQLKAYEVQELELPHVKRKPHSWENSQRFMFGWHQTPGKELSQEELAFSDIPALAKRRIRESFDVGSSGDGPVFDLGRAGVLDMIDPDLIEGVIDEDGFAYYPKGYGIESAINDLSTGTTDVATGDLVEMQATALNNLMDEESFALLALPEHIKKELRDSNSLLREHIDIDELEEKIVKVMMLDEQTKPGWVKVPITFLYAFDEKLFEKMDKKFLKSAVVYTEPKALKPALEAYFKRMNERGLFDAYGDYLKFHDLERSDFPMSRDIEKMLDDYHYVGEGVLGSMSVYDFLGSDGISELVDEQDKEYFSSKKEIEDFGKIVKEAKDAATLKRKFDDIDDLKDEMLQSIVNEVGGDVAAFKKEIYSVFPGEKGDDKKLYAFVKDFLQESIALDGDIGEGLGSSEHPDEGAFGLIALQKQLEGKTSQKELIKLAKKYNVDEESALSIIGKA